MGDSKGIYINSNDQVRGYAGDYTRTAAPVGWDLYFPKVQIPTFPHLSPCMSGSGALH